jgi:hypothetical protein
MPVYSGARTGASVPRFIVESHPKHTMNSELEEPVAPILMLITEAQHLRDGDKVLSDGNFVQNLLLDVLGKHPGAFLVT